jgi:hypothetical protein
MQKIPPAIIGCVGPILARRHTHDDLDSLFMRAGFPGYPPSGVSKQSKALDWLRRGNAELAEPLVHLGRLVAELLDTEPGEFDRAEDRSDVVRALQAEGLSYQRGGTIFGASLHGPSRTLAELLRATPFATIELEYERALKTVESDPGAAVTAACAILESVCKLYIEKNQIEMPTKQVLGQLWPLVADHLGLSPKNFVEIDFKKILQGLYTIGDSIAALRTHVGSAHGHAPKKTYELKPRHARLAVHAAHTMALFVLETWEARKSTF